jgi:arginine exporter protein ArgO
MNVNKKLWSFIFGCLIAASFVWLISLGKSAGVIEYFHQYPEFVIDYYALMITAIATACLTLFIVLVDLTQRDFCKFNLFYL